MFIELVSRDRTKTVLVSLASIWKIEITYGEPREGIAWFVDPQTAFKSDTAIRVYTIFAGSDTYTLPAKTDSKVMAEIEKLYQSRITDIDSSKPDSSA